MKNKQGLTIAALIIAIVGLSIGFAAFSNTLTISSSASVSPDDSAMNVVWSSSSSSAGTNAIEPTKDPNNVANFTATNATITGEDFRTLNNVSAAFTAPGQTVTYNLHVFNAGSYTAYLTNLAFGNKTCAAIPQQNASDTATGTLVQEACKGISISVTIGTETLTSSGSLNNQAIAPNASVQARVVITYSEGSSYVDGPMSVTFGNITFNASTVAGSSQGGNEQGGQEEPQQSTDALIATPEDLEGAEDKGNGRYTIASNEKNPLVGYETDLDVSISFAQTSYFYAFSDSFFEDNFGVSGLKTNTWYYTEDFETFTEYTGTSPISAETFANGTIYSQSYLNKVIASFSNNG